MLFVKCDAFSRASNLLVVCGCLFCEVVFQGLLVVSLVGLLVFVKWDVFSVASVFLLVRGLFQVLSLVCLCGQLFFVNCSLLASRASIFACCASLRFVVLHFVFVSGLPLTHLIVSWLLFFFLCG